MAFVSGPVTFSRFRVIGGSPKRLDERLLDKFREHVIGRRRAARAGGEEVGWIGGRHILDREFDADKNIILECLHLGLRVDVSRLPPELARAYFLQELDSLRKGNGHGPAAARLIRQARDAAQRRAEQEVREGRFRRMRRFPVLWDTREDTLYLAATSPAVHERLYPIFRETFDRRLEPLTAGVLAASWAATQGLERRLESARPARFTDDGAGDDPPLVWWTAHDPACRDFLGNEFLLWLWYALEEEGDAIELSDRTDAVVVMVRQLVLECPRAESGKDVVTCEGPARLPESRRAIAAGKLPRKAGLKVSRQDEHYEFTLHAETFAISGARLPRPEDGNDSRHADGNGNGRAYAEERVEQVRRLAWTVDRLYHAFLARRLSPDWPEVVQRIAGWLKSIG